MPIEINALVRSMEEFSPDVPDSLEKKSMRVWIMISGQMEPPTCNVPAKAMPIRVA